MAETTITGMRCRCGVRLELDQAHTCNGTRLTMTWRAPVTSTTTVETSRPGPDASPEAAP